MSTDLPAPVPPVPPTASTLPSPRREKRRLKRIGPLSAGTTLALLYGAIALIFMPFVALMMLAASHAPGAHPGAQIGVAAFGVGFAIAMPFLYAAMGFLTGVIGAALYNLFSRWTGGIEVEVE